MKHILFFLSLLLSVVCFVSCDKDETAIVEEDLNGFKLNPDYHGVEFIAQLPPAEQAEVIKSLEKVKFTPITNIREALAASTEDVPVPQVNKSERLVYDLRTNKTSRNTGDHLVITPSTPGQNFALQLRYNDGTFQTIHAGVASSIAVYLPFAGAQICNYYGYYQHYSWRIIPLNTGCRQFSIEYEVDAGGIDTDLYNITGLTWGYFVSKYDWNGSGTEIAIMAGGCAGGFTSC